MLNIDEAIEILKNGGYLTNREEKQLAEWLEELKAIKSDGFTDDLLNMGLTKGYNKAIDHCIKIAKAYRNTWDGIELAIRDIEELKEGVTSGTDNK